MGRKNELDLTEGSILNKLIVFALPILGVNILQLLFNTADTIVLGRFAAEDRATMAVGAVSSTTSLINLLIGFFVGIALGANVMVAKSKGAGDIERSRRYVGSSVALSLVAGVILLLIGFFGARTFLSLMQCKDELLEAATAYLKIYFLGMPIIMFYNFAAAILRAVGDTLRPLIFLVIGGIINVGLNIFFVTVLKIDVEGVAIATVASNFVSALCCLIVMLKSNGYGKLEFKKIRFYKNETMGLLYVGVPSGLQKVFFNISNVLIQSSINSMGELAIAGNGVAHTIDSYVHEVGEAIAISTLSFTSQNLGARKYDRILKTLKTAIITIIVSVMTVGGVVILFAEPICLFVRNDPTILPYATTRLYVMASCYVICCIMNVFGYTLRGMGKSFTSMIISLMGGCVLRLIFVYVGGALFPQNFLVLFLSYPLSWTITILVQIVVFTVIFKRLKSGKYDERLFK